MLCGSELNFVLCGSGLNFVLCGGNFFCSRNFKIVFCCLMNFSEVQKQNLAPGIRKGLINFVSIVESKQKSECVKN